jgi:hypothetical protein
MPARFLAVILAALLLSTSVHLPPAKAADAQTILCSHWVQGWGFRDELNPHDIDYQNFWTDNAGKILTAGLITNDLCDVNRALEFIRGYITGSYYLPEAVVNSSIPPPQIPGANSSITNRIVLLSANKSLPELQQLSIGNYYARPWTAGYLGPERIWYNGSAHRALSANVTWRPDGYIERAFFSFNGVSFYTYLNATITVKDPYVRVSLRVQPLNSTFAMGDHVDLQVFAGATGGLTQYAFENVTKFDAQGNPTGVVPRNSASAPGRSTAVIAYSNRTSVFGQDSVALVFDATSVSTIEHWYQDGPFDKLSWIGLGYDFPMTRQGELSAPVYTSVYPIEHLDYHLLSDTAKYLMFDPKGVAVAPPVSFGFVARGLALASNLDSANVTLRRLATGYWNFYYQRYEGTRPDTAYARATSVFAMAGFELYRGNVTVEHFARGFVEGNHGSSIEESGWAVAALQSLYQYNKSDSDVQVLRSVNDSFIPGGSDYLVIDGSNKTGDTFHFAETAAGLLSAGSSYNNHIVLWAMNAVFASNSSGVLLNTPRNGDLANTETIPAYMLSMWMFKNAMRSHTGCWIDWVQNANITAISYRGGQLEVDVSGRNGSLALGTAAGTFVYHGVNGKGVLLYPPPGSSTNTTIVSSSSTSTSGLLGEAVTTVGAVLILVGLIGFILLWRKRRRLR